MQLYSAASTQQLCHCCGCCWCVLQEVAHAEIIRALKVEQAKELTKLRQEFELQARELGSKYEKRMKMLRDDLELRRKQEIHEIEEHKVSAPACRVRGLGLWARLAAACGRCTGWVADLRSRNAAGSNKATAAGARCTASDMHISAGQVLAASSDC